ncbi:putative E3 ubiquitin-protein ligase RF298 [Tasmannia lanceolata]|uniref:putative E3 ubiquitin-protein ligase RF298 n=1 Tax=Tasmannia lanceolata TaxID=3420 RepID=UPI004063373E
MAALIARGCGQLSSSVSVQEKGSRNKRKFRSPHIECSNYEFPGEKSQNNPCLEHHGLCDSCSLNQDQPNMVKSDIGSIGGQGSLDLGNVRSREELEVEEFEDADWSDLTESQLEELLLSNLDTIFKSAVKTISSFGYNEEIATTAVLRSGLCHGCKLTASNIVDSTLAFLRNGREIDCPRDHFFEDLPQLEKYILAEFVCVLREVRPFFSTGDAMWCLLICDMDVSHACAMDGDPLSRFGNDETPVSSSVSVPQPRTETNSSVASMSSLNIPKPNKPNPLLPHPQSSHSDIPTTKDSSPITREYDPTMSQSSAPEEKPGGNKKGHTNSSKRESILRQKPIHIVKNYRAYVAKGALTAGKVRGLGGLMLDKKCKSVLDSNAPNLKNASLKLSRAVGVDASQANGSTNLSINVGLYADVVLSPKTVSRTSASPVANTELSLSLSSKTNGASKPNHNAETQNCSFSGISSDKILGQWVPEDKKDEVMLKLVPRVRELQTQLQEWTEWAQQKVMQAARRLSKDKEELKTLRQEKEEVARIKKEKQTLEESTMKKLSEMENAWSKASKQVEWDNDAVRRLEVENSKLRLEMEVAKLRALESAANCREISRREKKTLEKFQSWERQKALFQEELVTERHKLSQLQQQLEHAKEFQDQLEARWRQEGKVKDEAFMKANSERKEREQIEASAKSKEDMITLKSENDFQRYKDDVRRLEREIAQLRLKTDSSKMAALRWGINGSYASRLTEGRSALALKETNTHYTSDMADFQELGFVDVQREWECVMCLTEEMSVVFLPCAHQVVCTKCNELHEKQGMKDCPSCRTPIQRRICVRFAAA